MPTLEKICKHKFNGECKDSTTYCSLCDDYVEMDLPKTEVRKEHETTVYSRYGSS